MWSPSVSVDWIYLCLLLSASINSTSNGTAVQQRQKQGGLWGMLCCVRQGDQPPGQLRTAFQNEAPPSPRVSQSTLYVEHTFCIL